MKIKLFSTQMLVLPVLLLISISSFAQRSKDDFTGPSKNYSKTYAINGNDKLRIENSYGKVTINTWDKNEFKVDVQVKVSTSRGNEQKLLDNITISDSKSGSTVSFKTNIGRQNYNSGNQKMAINYTVYMPAKNALDIS